MDNLKTACEMALIMQHKLVGTPEQVCQLLVMADLYTSPSLRTYAMETLQKSKNVIIESKVGNDA
jgi:hypothetical protein